MKISTPHIALSLIAAAVVTLTACGGGSSGSTAVSIMPPPVAVATTAVSTTVIDGLIKNALVCVDANNNGTCDAGETQARTDVNGKVTLQLSATELANARLIAMIGTDAVDADTGPVTTAYTLQTPAGRHSVISPLTTMVQTKMDTDKVSADAAEIHIKAQLGLSISVFDNFIALRSHNNEYKKAGEVARMLVVSIQKSKRNTSGSGSNNCHLESGDDDHAKENKINEELLK
ncbi:MAG: hypothetical protein Q7J77_02730, partial [Undibacterium sp.]|nr:hypothetical protein [Undibacterium sp.]